MQHLSKSEEGISVFFMVLAIIVMLVVIFATLSQTDDTFSVRMIEKGTQAKTSSYVSMIVNRTRRCAVDYPNGDSSDTFPRYPTEPTSGDFDDVLCPGAPSGSQELFDGTDGLMLPGQPSDIASVTYGNDANGVYFDFAPNDPVDEWPTTLADDLGQGGSVITGNVLRAFVQLP